MREESEVRKPMMKTSGYDRIVSSLFIITKRKSIQIVLKILNIKQ